MSLWSHDSYKEYMLERLGGRRKRTGERSRLANVLSCQSAFVSQVLNGDAHFSTDQAWLVCQFLGLNQVETNYFLLLVQRERAGNAKYKDFLTQQISDLRQESEELKSRLNVEEVTEAEKAQYYSHWVYVALHMASSMEKMVPVEELALRWQIPVQRLREAFEFLERFGFIRFQNGRFFPQDRHLHLGRDSIYLRRHHQNWRLQAMRDIEAESSEAFHYSGVYTLSEKVAKALKERMLEFIQENVKQVEASAEEAVYCYNMDFFRLL